MIDAKTDVRNGELVITRVINAPRELVWKAFTEKERLLKWWGPKGFKMLEANLDLRPGGRFHYGMEAPGGGIMWGKFEYREINAPESIVFVNSFSDEEGNTAYAPFAAGWPLEMLNTWVFTENGGKTTLILRSYPINATADEEKVFAENHPSMNQGFSGTFGQLDQYLESLGQS